MNEPADKNKQTAFEKTDVNVRSVALIGAWIFIIVIATSALMIPYYRMVERRLSGASSLKTVSPAQNTPELSEPLLEIDSSEAWRQFRLVSLKKASAYGWVDKDKGIAHIPVDKAIDEMLRKGFQVRGKTQ